VSRVLWDDVPAEVKADLATRGPAEEGARAIVDVQPGERWYFRRTRDGWNHLSTDRAARAAPAEDLTPEQKAERAVTDAVLTKVLERVITKALETPQAKSQPASEASHLAYVPETTQGLPVTPRWKFLATYPITLTAPARLLHLTYELPYETIHSPFLPGNTAFSEALLEVTDSQVSLTHPNGTLLFSRPTHTRAVSVLLVFDTGLHIRINV
jgi:hypothetical protein